MVNGLQKEYQLSMKEVNAFLKWYKQRDAGEGPVFMKLMNTTTIKDRLRAKRIMSFLRIF